MTSNQLTYWQNVERERANRAQEQTIPSTIQLAQANASLSNANTELSQAKAVTEVYNALMKQFDVSHQEQSFNAELAKTLADTSRLNAEAQKKMQDYYAAMYNTEVAQRQWQMMNDSGGDFVAGSKYVGDWLRNLFGGLFSASASVSAKA